MEDKSSWPAVVKEEGLSQSWPAVGKKEEKEGSLWSWPAVVKEEEEELQQWVRRKKWRKDYCGLPGQQWVS